jgi:hypothetical protein
LPTPGGWEGDDAATVLNRLEHRTSTTISFEHVKKSDLPPNKWIPR